MGHHSTKKAAAKKPAPAPAPAPVVPPPPIVNYNAPPVVYQDASTATFDNGGVAADKSLVSATESTTMAAQAANPEVAAGSEASNVAAATASQFNVTPDAAAPTVAASEPVPKKRRGRSSLSIPFAGTSGFTSGGVFIPYA